jgi:histidine triad (HIT) family protein
MAEKTIFGKIIDREIPADVVYEDDRAMAFRDIDPQAPTHVLIIPKREIPTVDDIAEGDEALAGHLFVVAGRVAEKLGVVGQYRLVVNCGEGAGQEVMHVHLHMLAGRPFTWPPG